MHFFALKGQIQRTMECGPMEDMIMLTEDMMALETNPPCVPKRLSEVSFVLPQEEDCDPNRETVFTIGFETSEYN